MTCRPSAVTATPITVSVWPVRVRVSFPLARFHTRTAPSRKPPMTCRPSGVTATASTGLFPGLFQVRTVSGLGRVRTVSRLGRPNTATAAKIANGQGVVVREVIMSKGQAGRTT